VKVDLDQQVNNYTTYLFIEQKGTTND
jgi:hypothetical protein